MSPQLPRANCEGCIQEMAGIHSRFDSEIIRFPISPCKRWFVIPSVERETRARNTGIVVDQYIRNVASQQNKTLLCTGYPNM